jgi:predicted RNA-binding protein (virulence factor B family)
MRLPNKDISALVLKAQRQGWDITVTNNTHLKWVSPSGETMFSSMTPRSPTAIIKIKKDLRLRGFLEVKQTKRKPK